MQKNLFDHIKKTDKKIDAESSFKLFSFSNPIAQLRNTIIIIIKSMRIGLLAKNYLQLPKTMFLPQKI